MAHAYLTRHYACPALAFRETLMNVLCRENTHGHSQSQSNGDQRRVDALPRLIKQRVVIAPVRKMQMQSESLEDAHRERCVYRAICYDILRLNLHTQ